MPNDLTDKLHAAFGSLQAGDLAGAERLCGEVLGESPRNPDALHLLGVVRLAGGKAGDAVSLIEQALELNPRDAAVVENLGIAHLALRNYETAERTFRKAFTLGASHGPLHMRLGIALASQGKLADALSALRDAAARSPEVPDVHLNLGNVLAEQGEAEQALACYQQVLALQPDNPLAHFNVGNLHRSAGRLAEAAASYQQVLAIAPDDADTHNNLGLVHERQQRLAEAAASYRRALALRPDHVHARSNLGNVLRAEGRLAEAAACYEDALAIRSDFVDALNNLGIVHAELGRPDEAKALYDQVVRLDPRNADAHRNLGALFRRQGRLQEAIACFRTALEFAPGQADVYNDLGTVLRDGGDFGAALATYRKAMASDPQSALLHYNVAETLKVLGRFDEAIEAYERALALKPGYLTALGGLIYVRQHVCDWDGIEILWERLRREALGKQGSVVSPFSVLYMPVTAEEQLACAMAWAHQALDRLAVAHAGRGFRGPLHARHPRMRIGYLSWDFHQHATAYLTAELFELHDRNRFEVTAYSYGPDDGSAIRTRIRNACEHFVDVSRESFVETARRIRGDGIDVLIDLKGYTLGSRPQILALRAAPVQASWLGFPGSMGTDCVDYVIADAFIIPQSAERYYSEKVVRLPHCYQVNDRKREVSGTTPSRAECGLPPQGFVFCCFNQTAKILPEVFSSWMRIMKAAPGSVLWLLESNRWAADNLRRLAAGHGVAPERLVFAPRRPMPEHLARYRLADLALDTFPYTSHTTASDALWVGCPLVTRVGNTFASRVAGSVLISAGMQELVTDSAESYERLAMELATSSGRLQDIRRRLREGRDACPLFDTPRFVEDLESAYEEMLRDFLAGSARS